MGVGALVGGAASVYNLYQNNNQVSSGQVVEAALGGALGGAVLGGGLVIAGAAAVIGIGALAGVGAACADGDCTNEGTALARNLGQAGETAAGIFKNTQRIPSASGTANYRIPDQLLPSQQLISEVKNVSQLSLTNQIKDFTAFAQQEGYTFELWVRESTRFSKPLQELIDKGQVALKYLETK